jgi:hypothetical protein
MKHLFHQLRRHQALEPAQLIRRRPPQLRAGKMRAAVAAEFEPRGILKAAGRAEIGQGRGTSLAVACIRWIIVSALAANA